MGKMENNTKPNEEQPEIEALTKDSAD